MNEYRLIMFNKNDSSNKYALAGSNNDDNPINNNVLKDEPFYDPYAAYRRQNFRNILAQCLATGAKNLLLLTYGMTLGISTIAIPALEANTQNNSNLTPKEREFKTDILHLSIEQISWFSSINLICVPIGCFMSGVITEPLGRKKSMMLLNIPFLIVWVLYYNAKSVVTLYVALVISGLAGGLHEAPVLTYLAEISEPHLRGVLGATAPTTVIIGTVSQLVMGNFFHWRKVVMINMIFPVIAFTALYFVPESPYWLINKGRLGDAEKSLRWLRGWVQPYKVEHEFSMLKKSILGVHKEKPSWRELLQCYNMRTFLIPHVLLMVTFCVGQFGGMTSLQTNAVKLFTLLGTKTDKYTSTLILGIISFCGAVVCVTLVRWTGKRVLLIMSTLAMAFCLFTLAVYDYYHSYAPVPFIENFSWVPIVFFNLNAFFIHTGIRLLPWVLVGEVYPTNIRGFAAGTSALWFYVFAFSANKSFYWMIETLHLFGLLVLYGTVITIGSLFFYFFLPETEGFMLYDIEKHFGTKGNIFKTKIYPKKSCEIELPECPPPADSIKENVPPS